MDITICFNFSFGKLYNKKNELLNLNPAYV